jgi:heat shock protein HslJ
MIKAVALVTLLVSACQKDETISRYVDPASVWQLAELDGKPFNIRATITFPGEGRIAGQAPCNRYSGTQTSPYPWFHAGPLIATKMACPDLMAENVFFEALADMTLSEAVPDALILSNDAGRAMVFRRAQD